MAEAHRAEALGYSTLLLRDHFVPEPFGEQLALLVALAARGAGSHPPLGGQLREALSW